MARHCYVLRVFTRGDIGGNHLGVVTDVTGLTDQQMQDVAADLGFSETIYVDWREGDVPHVRIFTPGTELPFAGHPLVGAGWVLTTLGPGGPDRLRCGIGEVGLHFDGTRMWVEVPLDQPVSQIPDSSITVEGMVDSWQVEMPLPYLIVQLAGAEQVSDYQPDEQTLERAGGMVYLVAGEGESYKARFFAPAAAIFEDPATGSAAVAWAALEQHRGKASGSMVIAQGDEVGAPSTIDIEWSEGKARLGGTVRRDEVRMLDV